MADFCTPTTTPVYNQWLQVANTAGACWLVRSVECWPWILCTEYDWWWQQWGVMGYYQTHAPAVGLDSPLPHSLCAAINQLGGTKMLQLLGRGLHVHPIQGQKLKHDWLFKKFVLTYLKLHIGGGAFATVERHLAFLQIYFLVIAVWWVAHNALLGNNLM